jgi:hypothetical protein
LEADEIGFPPSVSIMEFAQRVVFLFKVIIRASSSHDGIWKGLISLSAILGEIQTLKNLSEVLLIYEKDVIIGYGLISFALMINF